MIGYWSADDVAVRFEKSKNVEEQGFFYGTGESATVLSNWSVDKE